MSQIQSKFLANDAVTTAKIANDAVNDAKIRLSNNAFLKARNAANSANVNILRVNASDVIEFNSFPQASGTPSSANELVNKSYVDGLVNGLSWKNPVRVASTAPVTISSAPASIDGITLASGNRVLLKDQSAGAENGIYIFNGTGSAMTRALDMDASAETVSAAVFVSEGTTNADRGFVQTADTVTLGTTALVFTQFTSTISSVIGGDMVTVAGSTVSVDLATTSGLESSNPGNVAGQLRVKLEASNPSLQIDGSNQLGAKLNGAGAIVSGASGLGVQLEASNPTLQIATNRLGVKLDSAGAVITGANGVAVQLESTNPTLQIASNRLGAKLNAAGAIVTGANGLAVQVDGVTVKINGSNQLESFKFTKETFTLSAGDITNQYIDLAQVAATNSIDVKVKGGPTIIEGASHDFSVSYTGGVGGKSRISFLNDLATGGVAALVAGDVVQIMYEYL